MHRSSFLRALAALAVISATLVGFAGAASAQTEGETCTTVQFGGAIDSIGHNLLNPAFPVTPTIPVDLPAGEVSIPEAISTDSYPSRVDVTQTSEIWVVEFIGADGSVVGTSAPTTDVPDMVETGEWVGPLGTVTLTAPAVGVRAAHRPNETDQVSPHSVNASEVTICTSAPDAPVCPTNADGTPVDPTDPDCPDEEAPACPTGADGTPVDPTDPDCPQEPLNPDPPPAPACPTNADGTPVDPTDPDCPQEEAPACPTNADGTPVDPTDPDCPDEEAPLNPDAPQQQSPTSDQPTTDQPTLPVTGAETSVFVLGGLWLLAAGTALVMFGSSRKSLLR